MDFEEVLEYLDDLRESGTVNMFGAGSWLVTTFDLSEGDAKRILAHWMDTFEERHGSV